MFEKAAVQLEGELKGNEEKGKLIEVLKYENVNLEMQDEDYRSLIGL